MHGFPVVFYGQIFSISRRRSGSLSLGPAFCCVVMPLHAYTNLAPLDVLFSPGEMCGFGGWALGAAKQGLVVV